MDIEESKVCCHGVGPETRYESEFNLNGKPIYFKYHCTACQILTLIQCLKVTAPTFLSHLPELYVSFPQNIFQKIYDYAKLKRETRRCTRCRLVYVATIDSEFPTCNGEIYLDDVLFQITATASIMTGSAKYWNEIFYFLGPKHSNGSPTALNWKDVQKKHPDWDLNLEIAFCNVCISEMVETEVLINWTEYLAESCDSF